MNVAFDTNALYNSRAGVARYVQGLLGGLRERCGTGVNILPFAWEVENLGAPGLERSCKTLWRELVWARWIAPRRLLRSGAGLYHATGTAYFVPPSGITFLATVHDLAAIRCPERFRGWQRRQRDARVRRLLRARQFVCISRFTADELMREFGVSAERIEVVYNGADDPSALSRGGGGASGLQVPDEFLLFVGSLEPGKNLALLRRVYELAAGRGVALPPLLIAGARWPGVAHEGAPPDGWRYLGRIADETLVMLYRRAAALVFPSRYEGFGLPVAEAMLAGCPVICSPVASLPEVGGKAALFVDQTPEAYLAGIRLVLDDPVRRAEMIAAGREQAAGFSWSRCADGYLAVYRNLHQ
ncbi:MAG TPA: hypothetical protein DCY13_00850 [Verrucomicrobiales bacterium]|nr:hypothetical protein [Verrucomicrobiales bacterium]